MPDTIPPPSAADLARSAEQDLAACEAAPECWYIPADVHPENRDELRDEWLYAVQLGFPAWIRRAAAAERQCDRLREALERMLRHVSPTDLRLLIRMGPGSLADQDRIMPVVDAYEAARKLASEALEESPDA